MIITVANQKGGVGKTTTAVNLAHALSLAGYGVLVCDLDRQGNTTKTLTGDTDFHGSIRDLLLEDDPPSEYIAPGYLVDIIPSSKDLPKVTWALSTDSSLGYQMRLKNRLSQISDNYDFVIIDTGPSLDLLTVNALSSSDGVIIPLSPGGYELDGTQQLFETIRSVKQNFNPNLKILGILLTMTDHTKICRQVEATVRESMGDKVFETTIPLNVSVKEASAATDTTLYHHAPHSKGAEAYALFTKEVREKARAI